MGGAPILRLELSASPVLAGAILLAHAGAAGSVLLAVPGAAGGALAILLVALGGASAWGRALLRSVRSPRAIEIASSGEAWIVQARGERIAARPVRGIGVSRWWVMVRYRREGFLVSAGMLEPATFRRLRMWALWERSPAVARGQLQG